MSYYHQGAHDFLYFTMHTNIYISFFRPTAVLVSMAQQTIKISESRLHIIVMITYFGEGPRIVLLSSSTSLRPSQWRRTCFSHGRRVQGKMFYCCGENLRGACSSWASWSSPLLFRVEGEISLWGVERLTQRGGKWGDLSQRSAQGSAQRSE